MMKRNSIGPATCTTAVILVLAGLGADAPKQTIQGEGLKFEAPAAWKSTRPRTGMRVAQLSIEAVEPDKESAELAVFFFPGGAGTVQDNIKRWQDQFVDEGGNPPKITREKRKGKNVDVTFAEVAGRYVAAVRPGSPEHLDKPGFRLLGGIVESARGAFFLKLVGPDKTVKAAKPAFEDLISSITVEDK